MSGLHSGIPVSTIGTGVWVRWGPYEQPIGAPVSTIGEGVWARWDPSSRSGWHIGSLRLGAQIGRSTF